MNRMPTAHEEESDATLQQQVSTLTYTQSQEVPYLCFSFKASHVSVSLGLSTLTLFQEALCLTGPSFFKRRFAQKVLNCDWAPYSIYLSSNP